MAAYYNENDPFAVAWLRELIKAGMIAPGEVDERSIAEVQASDIKGYVQCHFFAGIGGWSYALRLSSWRDDMAVWTGSCPCQPFSGAGKRLGEADSRHLWPEFRRLITAARPTVVFGEQVASTLGKVWLAGVRADVEALGYEVGAADLCAAGVSAPHIRQRLYWVADAYEDRAAGGDIERLAIANCGPRQEISPLPRGGTERSISQGNQQLSQHDGGYIGLGHPNRYHRQWWSGPLQVGRNTISGEVTRGGRRLRAQWRIEPSVPLLAHGISNRVGKLCGFGNAIVPQVAAEFIAAWMDIPTIERQEVTI